MIDRACISLSNICNLKCKYCHFADKQKDFDAFNFDDIKTILDNIHNYCVLNNLSTFKLGIVGAGEPLTKKALLFELIKYVHNNSYKEIIMYTITNGTLLTKRDIEFFYAYKNEIKLCFSLDGYKEIHNAGRKRFDEVMKSIELYKKIFNESPSINATVNRLSYENKERVAHFFKDNRLNNVTFSILSGYFEKDLYISGVQYNEFMNYMKCQGISSRQFKSESSYDCTMYGKLCGVGRTNIFIAKEGVYPCGRFYKNDKYKIGEFYHFLNEIEKEIKNFTPVNDGECYYKKHLEE